MILTLRPNPRILFVMILCFGLLGCIKEPVTLSRPLLEPAYSEIKASEGNRNQTQLATSAPITGVEGGTPKALTPVPDFLATDTAPISNSMTVAPHSTPLQKGFQRGNHEKIQLNLENISVYDFVNLVLGEVLKVNYSISPDIAKQSDKISLNMSQEMEPEPFYLFALKILAQHGVVIENTPTGYFAKRSSKSHASTEMGDIYFGTDLPFMPEEKKIISVVPVNYLTPSDIRAALLPFLPNKKTLQFFALKKISALGLSGSYGEVDKVLNLLKILDRPYIKDKKISLLTFSYLPVDEFIDEIKEILTGIGIPINSKASPGGVILLPLKPLNALLVISPKQSWLKTVIYWQEKYDTIDALGDKVRMFVYMAKNRPASELLEVLEALTLTDTVKNMPESQAALSTDKIKSTNKIKPANNVPPINGGIGVAINKMTVSIDRGRNALVIAAKPIEYKNIEAILTQLDTLPRQVLAEVTVAEVTLTDQFEFGVEWFFRNEGGKYNTSISTLDGLSIGGSGLNFIVNKLDGNFLTTINANSKEDIIKIVSTPHITVLDGQTATINVGTEVPVVTSETTEPDLGTGSILRNIQYRTTGVNLTVTPVVNSDDIVTMTIAQSLSEAQINTTSSIDSPLILNRSLETVLSLKSGETVLLGGLIGENHSNGSNSVPWISTVPLIGKLFSTESKGYKKTELIVQITPYVLKNSRELDALTQGFKSLIFNDSE